MSSIEEYAKTLPKIVIDADLHSHVLIEIKLGGSVIARKIIMVEHLNYRGCFTNSFSLHIQEVSTELDEVIGDRYETLSTGEVIKLKM